jgi:ABC-type transporter Mla MlaB component
MQPFSHDEVFSPIWAKMQTGELKTANVLRLDLELISAKFNTSSLALLVAFREWLLKKNIELTTTYGEISYTAV